MQAAQDIEAKDGALSTYEQSDLLWGKAVGVAFTEQTITVKYHHILAGVRVQLNKGTDISATEWEKLEKIVLIDHTQRQATIDLATGASHHD